jgi:hypothetical protein
MLRSVHRDGTAEGADVVQRVEIYGTSTTAHKEFVRQLESITTCSHSTAVLKGYPRVSAIRHLVPVNYSIAGESFGVVSFFKAPAPRPFSVTFRLGRLLVSLGESGPIFNQTEFVALTVRLREKLAQALS